MSANAPLIVVAVGTVLALVDRLAVIVLCRMALRRGVDFEGRVKTFGRSLTLKVKAAETQLRPEDSTTEVEAIAGPREVSGSMRAAEDRSRTASGS
jgi:hypothetical protein